MRNAAPKDGQDHDTTLRRAARFAAALVALVAAATSAPAPLAAQGAVPCTAIADDAERLACYDHALRGTPPATPPPAAAAPAAPPAVGTPAPDAEAGERADGRRREGRVREPAAAAVPAAPAAAPAPATAARRNGGEEEIVPLVIVGVRTIPGRETIFTAENGTVWVQTDSQRIIGLPDPPFEAELKPGAIGSLFLVPEGRRRAIRVRQVTR
jgi:hypothetical protein